MTTSGRRTDQILSAATPTSSREVWLQQFDRTPMTADLLRDRLSAVVRVPAVSTPVLDFAVSHELAAAADRLSYRPARPVIGEGDKAVFQQFDYCDRIPAGHPVLAFRDWLENRINEALDVIEPRPLADRFRINDVVCQRYRAGDRGITPHRDHVRYTGLIVVVVLNGEARYCVCADRAGASAETVTTAPGWAIFMPAPGFAARVDRPFHFVDSVSALRHTIGLRHDSRRGDCD